MSLHSFLRLAHPLSELEILCQKYMGSMIIDTRPEERYLQVRLRDSLGISRKAILNIDNWLLENNSLLPEICWHRVPLGYLLRWVRSLEICFSLGNKLLHVEGITLPQKSIPQKLLSLPSHPCPLLCEDWPGDSTHIRMDKIYLFQIPFSVDFILGCSQLPLSQIVNLKFGDLILIKNNMSYLSIRHQKIFKFSYLHDEEIIVNEKITANDEGYNEEIIHDWLDLTVNIEFLLDNKIMTLAEINDISLGRQLSLTPGAEQSVKILLNKKTFALGELVALENSSLAVEVSKIYPVLDDNKANSCD